MCPMILGFASAAIGAASSVMGGMMQQSQAKAQAAAYDRQSVMTLKQGEYEAGRKVDEVNAITGRQVALTGGSGVTLEGSPTDVIGSTASEGQMDIGAIRWGAKTKADTLAYQGRLERIQGQNAMAGGVLGGIGSLVGGLGKLGASPSPTAKNPNATYFGNMFGTA